VVRVESSGRRPPPEGEVRLVILGEAEAATKRACHAVEREWKAIAPARTGHYRRSITSDVRRAGNTIYGQVGTTVFYAPYLEYGTGIYGPRKKLIRPKRKKALRFPEPGNPAFTLAGRQRSGAAGAGARWVYARWVRGIKPMHLAQKAFEAAGPLGMGIYRAAGYRAGERIAEL
jgi:Bacteriophage HK97-gp10, putative tail-component